MPVSELNFSQWSLPRACGWARFGLRSPPSRLNPIPRCLASLGSRAAFKELRASLTWRTDWAHICLDWMYLTWKHYVGVCWGLARRRWPLNLIPSLRICKCPQLKFDLFLSVQDTAVCLQLLSSTVWKTDSAHTHSSTLYCVLQPRSLDCFNVKVNFPLTLPVETLFSG